MIRTMCGSSYNRNFVVRLTSLQCAEIRKVSMLLAGSVPPCISY